MTTSASSRPRRGAAPFIDGSTLNWHGASSWRSGLWLFLLGALLIFAVDCLGFWLLNDSYQMNAGTFRARYFLDGVSSVEQSADGQSYRWTLPEATIRFTTSSVSDASVLTLTLGPRPDAAVANLSLGGSALVAVPLDDADRHIRLLLPPETPNAFTIGLSVAPLQVAGDNRTLGMLLRSFGLEVPQGGFRPPSLPLYFAQLVMLLALLITSVRLRWSPPAQALAVLFVIVLPALRLVSDGLAAQPYAQQMALAFCALAALTWFVLAIADAVTPDAAQRAEIRVLWSIALLACLLRLMAVLYPTFNGQDIPLNVRRLMRVIDGDLIIVAGSSEFAGGQTIYPPLPYIAAMPLLLIFDNASKTLQAFLAVVDGTTALFVGLLARRLGGSLMAGRSAALLFAGSYAALAALNYSFSAQIFGQWFTAPIALLLLAPGAYAQTRRWLAACLLLLFAMLSHIGVAILAVAWMGLLALLSLWPPNRHGWWRLGLYLGTLGLAVIFLYSPVLTLILGHAGRTTGSRLNDALSLPGLTPGLWRGLWHAFNQIGGALAALGLVLVLGRSERRQRDVIIAAIGAALLFLAVNVFFGLQVRYFYFLVPLAFATAGVLLGTIAGRGRIGKTVAWSLTVALVLFTVIDWVLTAFYDGKLTMTVLTH
ncbi:hypothetical protein HC891_13460 [Candidatus Gracilibacteria bacterium]|nr:hypothetical protein [Candidatus Gracilibacteria bacterium]